MDEAAKVLNLLRPRAPALNDRKNLTPKEFARRKAARKAAGRARLITKRRS